MNESESTHVEGNAEFEAAEQKLLGSNYEKAEVVHRYAENNSWVHPAMGISLVVLILLLIVYFKKR